MQNYSKILDQITKLPSALVPLYLVLYAGGGQMEVTNKELGYMLGLAPETISRQMSRLKKLGYVDTAYIPSGTGLRRFVQVRANALG